jgi:hypothetical protein
VKPQRRTSSSARIFSKTFSEKRESWALGDENPERNMEEDKNGFKKTYLFSDVEVEVMITEDKTVDEIREKLRVSEIN